MTYLEKLREITGEEIEIDQENEEMLINGRYERFNCPTSWFKFDFSIDKFCDGKNFFCKQANGFTKCWNREYQGEEYSGRLKIETKEFTVNDIKAGMLVELRDKTLGVVIPVLNELEIFDKERCALVNVSFAFKDESGSSFAIVKVYGLSKNYDLFEPSTRKLLWERKSKTFTISEAEKLLSERFNETVKIEV